MQLSSGRRATASVQVGLSHGSSAKAGPSRRLNPLSTISSGPLIFRYILLGCSGILALLLLGFLWSSHQGQAPGVSSSSPQVQSAFSAETHPLAEQTQVTPQVEEKDEQDEQDGEAATAAAGGGGGAQQQGSVQSMEELRAAEPLGEKAKEDPGKAEAQVLSKRGWRYRIDHPAGYLYAWTAPSEGARIAWPNANNDTVPVGLRRVGGMMNRLGAVAVAAWDHTLAVDEDGALFSWGPATSASFLGHSAPPGHPGRVWGVPGRVAAVAAGTLHSVAVTEDGRVYSWGHNNRGQLGRWPTTEEELGVPGQVLGCVGHQKIVSVASGPFFTLAVSHSGEVFTWGTNFLVLEGGPAAASPWSSEGDNAPQSKEMKDAAGLAARPRRVGGPLEGRKVVDVACGHVHWLGRTDDGTVFSASTGYEVSGAKLSLEGPMEYLGRKEGDKALLLVPGRVDVSGAHALSIAASASASYAAAGDRGAYSWGKPGPALGRDVGSSGPGDTPWNIPSVADAVQVAAGDDFALALTKDGIIYTWGDNSVRQLGRTPEVDKDPEAKPVSNVGTLQGKLVAAGAKHGLAICHPRPGTDPSVMADEERDLKLMLPKGGEEGAAGKGKGRMKVTGFPVIYDEHHREEIESVARDVLERLPKGGYEDKYKNPCWKEGDQLQCLPSFFIAGAFRAGAQDLFNRIVNQPLGIVAPMNSAPQWWDERTMESFGWYVDNFRRAAEQIAEHEDWITGESSSMYLTHSGVRARGTLVRSFVLPELIYSFLPNSKIVALLRNPIQRWRSEFLKFEQRTPADFENEVHRCVNRMKECIAQTNAYQCTQSEFRDFFGIIRSMYSYFLPDWFTAFGRENVLVLKFEEYVADTRGHIQKVLDHIGVSTAPTEEQWVSILGLPVDKGPNSRHPPLQPEMKAMLESWFAPHNEALAKLLGDDKWLWKDGR